MVCRPTVSERDQQARPINGRGWRLVSTSTRAQIAPPVRDGAKLGHVGSNRACLPTRVASKAANPLTQRGSSRLVAQRARPKQMNGACRLSGWEECGGKPTN